MPFDSATYPQADQATDPTALYRKRREDAAALWATVPVERFYIGHWSCGTTACALGHLGFANFDEWKMSNQPDGIPVRNGLVGSYAASDYFGLNKLDSDAAFGTGLTLELYRKSNRHITLADVSEKLLALPYALPTP